GGQDFLAKGQTRGRVTVLRCFGGERCAIRLAFILRSSAMTPRRALHGIVSFVALTALVAAFVMPVAAQAPKNDLIDQIKQRNEIAAQKIEAEVRDALADAQKRSAADPISVLERLKSVLAQLETDRALTGARRDLLTRQIQARIKTAEVEAEKLGKKNNDTN